MLHAVKKQSKSKVISIATHNSDKDYSNRLRRHSLERKRMNMENQKNNQEDMFTCTLEMVDALLKKDRVDANLLGMESLQLLTSQHSSSDAMIKFASNVVITGGAFSDIKDTISSLIAKYSIDGESPNNNVEDSHYEKMRVCALTVLSNALKFHLSDDLEKSKIDEILSSDDWLGGHGLLNMLLEELKNAKTNPNEAYLAGKSLQIVLAQSAQIRTQASTSNARKVISDCIEIGSSSYSLLESISKVLLELLV
jgi:hypothetical protein